MGNTLPQPVVDGINRYAKQHGFDPVETLDLFGQVKYDSIMRCYFFTRNGMYHGVELDGHIHT